jgi:hypothetical protein
MAARSDSTVELDLAATDHLLDPLVELNFFEYSDSKRFHVEPDVVEYNKDSRPQYDLILGTVTMKEFGIILNFKDKMLTIDEIILPMRNINHL